MPYKFCFRECNQFNIAQFPVRLRCFSLVIYAQAFLASFERTHLHYYPVSNRKTWFSQYLFSHFRTDSKNINKLGFDTCGLGVEQCEWRFTLSISVFESMGKLTYSLRKVNFRELRKLKHETNKYS